MSGFKAKELVKKNRSEPCLTKTSFAGVTDVPEQGYTIDEISETAEKATIKTTWKYSSEAVTKTFDLGKENEIWKVDSLQ